MIILHLVFMPFVQTADKEYTHQDDNHFPTYPVVCDIL